MPLTGKSNFALPVSTEPPLSAGSARVDQMTVWEGSSISTAERPFVSSPVTTRRGTFIVTTPFVAYRSKNVVYSSYFRYRRNSFMFGDMLVFPQYTGYRDIEEGLNDISRAIRTLGS